MGEDKRICGDVLIIPMWLSGHINPLMYVVKKLMKQGLTATMLLSEDETDVMKPHLEGEGMEGFHLEVVESRKKFKSRERAWLLNNSLTFGMACEPFLKRVLAEQQAGREGPKCMIADQFMGWTQKWATKLQIPRYVSIVSPATFGYCMYNHSANVKGGILKTGEDNPVLPLAGIPPVRLTDFSLAAKLAPKFFISSGDTFDESAGLLINTFYDLETKAIEAFRAQIKSKGGKGPKVLPIGPMLPPEFFSEGVYRGASEDSECIQWLDTRPASSVLYIAFGSTFHLSPPQILELANGLEASEESFLWVLLAPEAADPTALLPAGFQDRTKDRGLVYAKFAPQLHILSHPATGGFVTHCGWNSSLESICKGVPMIAWPLAADQRLCCRVLVDQAEVATEIRAGFQGRNELVSSAEVETAVRLLMRQPEGRHVKKTVLEMQSLARAAVGPCGSSTENFNTLVKDIQSMDSRILTQY